MGNLRSIANALEFLHIDFEVTASVSAVRAAHKLLLPGVGSFARGISNLRETGLAAVISESVQQGKPLMGICLGMQLLAEQGTEDGETEGFGFVKGRVSTIKPEDSTVRLPHYGWEPLKINRPNSQLLQGIDVGVDYYFVHSYALRTQEDVVVASYRCGQDEVAACLEKGHIWGAQFHPEKSKNQGLQILRNFGGFLA